MVDDSPFPSESVEARGRFVGFAESVGHALTFRILTDDTKKIIFRSSVCSALTAATRNRKLENLDIGNIFEATDPEK